MKNWKAILGVLLVFILGILAGGLLVHRAYQKKIQAVITGRQPVVAAEVLVRRMNFELRLTPEQRVQVIGIVRDTQRQLRETRQQVEPQVRANFQQMEQRISEVLTPEQQARFAKLMAERKARWPLFAPAQPPPGKQP